MMTHGHLRPLTVGGMITGPVTQEMIVVMGVTGIYLNQERALHFIPKNLLLDVLMVSVIIVLLEVGAMLTRPLLVAPDMNITGKRTGLIKTLQ
jgi:hypothetical protein